MVNELEIPAEPSVPVALNARVLDQSEDLFHGIRLVICLLPSMGNVLGRDGIPGMTPHRTPRRLNHSELLCDGRGEGNIPI